MRLPAFNYLEPASLEEAVQLLRDRRGKARLIAGGTDLVPLMKKGIVRPQDVISLKQIKKLRGLSVKRGVLEIGALTTIRELLLSPLLDGHFQALRTAARLVAAPALQNRGTVGGNVLQNTRCFYYNQSTLFRAGLDPCFKLGGSVCHAVRGGKRCFSVYQGDLASPVIALRGRARLQGSGGRRVVPVADLFSGKGKQPLTLDNDEILTHILIPVPKEPAASAYEKARVRGSLDYPLVSAAAVARDCGQPGSALVTVVLGAAGPAPKVLCEDRVIEAATAEASVESLAQEAYRKAEAVGNMAMPTLYRRKMAAVFTKRALRAALAQLGEAHHG